MKIILQRTRRKKSEHGFVFNERPQIINITHQFPCTTKDTDCACRPAKGHLQRKHIATVPFGKHYSPCEKKLNNCIPNTALTYETGVYSERPSYCEKCKG